MSKRRRHSRRMASRVGHTARGITKQNKNQQASKQKHTHTHKIPRAREVARTVLAQALGTIPVSPKETERKQSFQ